MQPSPMADTSKLLLPSLRFSIVSPWRWLSQRMNQPFWSAAMRKCSLPAAPAFAHFTEVLARFSENNFFACVQATADLRSTRSQFLSRQREFFLAVPKSVADSRGTAHPSPSFSIKVTACLLFREAIGVLVVWKTPASLRWEPTW